MPLLVPLEFTMMLASLTNHCGYIVTYMSLVYIILKCFIVSSEGRGPFMFHKSASHKGQSPFFTHAPHYGLDSIAAAI